MLVGLKDDDCRLEEKIFMIEARGVSVNQDPCANSNKKRLADFQSRSGMLCAVYANSPTENRATRDTIALLGLAKSHLEATFMRKTE